MTMQELFKQAYNDYLSICALVNGEDFGKSIENLNNEYDVQVMTVDDDLYDVNFGVCCFTINNLNGKADVNDKSVEVWKDDNLACLGTYTMAEIAEKGGIKD